MDIFCQHCDEPWEVCYVGHDMDIDGQKGDAERFKKGEGCPTCEWGTKGPATNSMRSMAMDALSDLLGDDIDGIASMLDDPDIAYIIDDFDNME